MKPLPVLSLIGITTLAAVLGASSIHATGFVNGDFETGFAGWTVSGGLWYGGTNYPADYAFNAGPFRAAVVGVFDVPCLTSKGVSVPQVRSGSYSACLSGNDGGGYHFAQIQQTVAGWTSPYFLFDFSAVLQDSSHTRAQRPHFRVILENLTTGTTIHNVAYYSDDATPGLWLRTGSAPDD